MKTKTTILLFFSVIFIFSCQNETSTSEIIPALTVRLVSEPDRLNPIISNTTEATQIENMILMPMIELDPKTLQYTPILVEEVPKKIVLEEGEFAGETLLSFRFREDAIWDDGSSITSDDYVFTLKAVFNPNVKDIDWLGFLSNILEVRVFPEDPKRFDVITEREYMLSLEAASNFNLFPKHIYDPEGLTDHVLLSDLMDLEKRQGFTEDEKLVKFGEVFSSESFSRTTVNGSGPYKLSEWETNQYIILDRKKDWWGNKLNGENWAFASGPEKIIYRFIPDETAAIASLKEGNIDILTGINSTNFLQLKSDTTIQNLAFHTPQLTSIYFFAINTKKPKLSDPKVRQALAHLTDIEQVIEGLLNGLGTPIVGPIMPDKEYYNRDLEPRRLDIDKARTLLSEAGWEDSNSNGILDKSIDGNLTELSIEILASGGGGQNIGLMLAETAKEVGIEINVVRSDYSSVIGPKVAIREYDIYASVFRSGAGDIDLYQSWHTASDNTAGSNVTGFGNQESDKTIEDIRMELDVNKRNEYYKKIQAQIYENQPAIFLFTPVETIVTNKKWNPVISVSRPGYFPNLFTLSE